VPLGSQATAWALQQTRDVPIVFAMVLNPVASGLVESMERPGGRVTGASLDIPLGLHFRTLREVVGARRVAVLFNPRETGGVVQAAARFAREEGVELVPIEVASARDLESALRRVDHSFDALWSVADRTVFSQGAVERVLLHTFERRIPFMGLSEQYVRAGALLALSTSYDENGRKAGQLVQRVLSGSRAGGLSVAVPERVEVVFNPRTAKRLELEVPESQLARMSLTN
jgi:putative ABC transport system substrate-binding protein